MPGDTVDPVSSWNRLKRIAPHTKVFNVMGRNLCFNSITCFFCEIDEPTAAVFHELSIDASYDDVLLRFSQNPLLPPLDEIVSELMVLVESGYLSADDGLLEPPKNSVPTLTTLSLIMATDCNLRCRYCYADEGTYHRPRSLMDISTAKRAVDFLIRKSHRAKEVGISFFGGEPLLNYDCITQLVPYAIDRFECNGQRCSFSITTNGTLLTVDKVAFFEKYNFGYIVSLDGPQNINDQNRIFPDGTGSYDSVMRRLSQLADAYSGFSHKVTIRATFTGKDHDLVSSLSHLRTVGFSKISLESCSPVPKHLAIDKENLSDVLTDYDAAAKWYLEQLQSGDRFAFYHMHQLFFQVAEGTKRISQCGAGRGYLAVAPDGVLYPCHRLVGDETYAMGSVFTGADSKIQSLFGSVSVPYKQQCRSCWARYICGGGCHATAVQFNHDILQPFDVECELMKYRIKLGAWLYAQLTNNKGSNGVTFNGLLPERPSV